MSLIPILILAFIVFFGYSLNRRQPQKTSNKLLSRKQWLKIFYFYCAILLVGTLLFFLLPKNEMKVISPSAIAQQDNKSLNQFNTIYKKAKQGKIATMPSMKPKKTWQFSYRGATLNMPNANEGLIIVKRKATNDGKIDVSEYGTRIVINQIDFTNKTNAPAIKIVNQKFYISNPKPVTVNMAKLVPEITVQQFQPATQIGSDAHSIDIQFSNSISLFYIQIPKDLKLTGTGFLYADS